MNEHYKIIVAGYNCYDRLERCVESIWNQTYRDFSVCVVDDASTDQRQRDYLAAKTAEYGWHFIQREVNAGAPQSQYEAVQLLNPTFGDVLVWVDLDDAFLTNRSLEILDSYYDEDTAMTFGSYQPFPPSPTCPPVTEYPPECIKNRDYRNIHKWGLRYNHLRTVRWDLFRHLNPETDFKKDGKWLTLAMDMAVMVPCLEMADGHHKYIPEPLYEYFSANPLSEWRKSAIGTNQTHDYLASLPRKPPTWTEEKPARDWLRNPTKRIAIPGEKPDIHVFIPSYNCTEWIERCLDSVANQTLQPKNVVIVDDASTDPQYAPLLRSLCDKYGYLPITNKENKKAPYNLYNMMCALSAEPEDVIFLLDGDDFLPLDALEKVAKYYEADKDLWLTYGSYESHPENTGQTMAAKYPMAYVQHREFRGQPYFFNHAITFKKHLWDQLTLEDFQKKPGEWFTVGYDAIIMHPMLEMAAPDHFKFLRDTLYYYNSVNDLSDYLVDPEGLDEVLPELMKRPKKERHVR